MHIIALDKETKTRIGVCLIKNLNNAESLRQKIISGELNCCAVKPSLIIDIHQVIIAANKAALAKKFGKLVTKSLNSELLYNLSLSKNITQSLIKFGLGDKDVSVLIVVFDEEGLDENFMAVKTQIDGLECSLTDIRDFSNINLIRETYKISELELSVSSLSDSVISRVAAKDFGSF